MFALLVNLSDGRTLSFPFSEWWQWAAHVESTEFRGFSLQNGASSSRFTTPRKFHRCEAKVEPIVDGDIVKGVKVRLFADMVVLTVTLYASGIVVSGIEKLGRRIGP